MPGIAAQKIPEKSSLFSNVSIYLDTSGRGGANGTYHRETGRHCESPREKGTRMIQALLPNPFSPAVNVGDVIVFLAFWAAILIGAKNGTRNGR